MATPAKFLFDTDFSAPDRSRERPTPVEMAQKLAAAEARAYRDGYDAGQRQAKAESDRRTALALEEIKIAMQGIAARFAGVERRRDTPAQARHFLDSLRGLFRWAVKVKIAKTDPTAGVENPPKKKVLAFQFGPRPMSSIITRAGRLAPRNVFG